VKKGRKVNESFWEDGFFAKAVSEEEMKEKAKTIHMKHDEDMRFSCRKCTRKISAHNKDWHDGMCDECFDKEYFPEK